MLPRPAKTIRNVTIFPPACCMTSREPMIFGAEVSIESPRGERSQTCLPTPSLEPTVDAG